ncbi:LysR family transcriptional regulator [Pseudoalteromonas denitrificans]|uniref:DNA-binding transcriptional regulator, LysR family n=1 Tax=Pseudoalteromonas denitrificans DSM 6059 TaxID=1123010 RepID=A0A1I1GYV9_9GAMM|nr:LysR family transcriptional regulator [Pseudoalteromonas denitrificans]SFC16997.1 DNA-binding transcriptional regulator, LysR family [Pseudoalteromonas denitrificans DSM 6059]
MELRTLKYFQAVYEHGSVSAAARNCFVSQPSITTAIKQLEETLSTKLFNRHARGVAPTAAAQKLYPLAKEMGQNSKTILNLFADGPTPVPLRLGIMRSLGAKRMSHLLTKLTDKIDNLEITLVDPHETCDARVVLSQSVNANESFVPIWTDTYELALPKAWSLAKTSHITINDLSDLPFINRTPCDALDKLKVQLTAQDIQFQTRANIRTIEYAWQLVSAGVGAALLPTWHEILEANAVIFKPIQNMNLFKDIGLAYTTERKEDPLISTLVDIC